MSETTTTEQSTEISEAIRTGLADGLAAVAEQAAEAARVAATEAAETALAAAAEGATTRGRAPVHGANEGAVVPAGSAARVSYAVDIEYGQLPEWERKYRTPENDLMFLRFLRGFEQRDQSAMGDVLDWNLRIDDSFERHMQRAMSSQRTGTELVRQVLTSNTGAYLIPTPTASLIVEKKRKMQAIGPRSMVFTSPNSSLKVPAQLAFAVVGQKAEGAAIDESDPTFAEVTLLKRKMGVISMASNESIEDAAFSIANQIIMGATRSLALQADAQDWADGDNTGDNQSEALLQNGDIAYADGTGADESTIKTLIFSLGSQYRSGCGFYGSNKVVGEMSKMVDQGGRNIFQFRNDPMSVLSGGQGAPGVGSFFNYPVIEAPTTNNASIATTGNSDDVLLFGDMSYFGTLEHGSIRVEESREYKFAEDLVAWKLVDRRDSAVLQAEAFSGLHSFSAP